MISCFTNRAYNNVLTHAQAVALQKGLHPSVKLMDLASADTAQQKKKLQARLPPHPTIAILLTRRL